MASPDCVLDTTTVLLFHVGIHKDELIQINTNRAIRPCNVMRETDERSWVVLHTSWEEASARALDWGFDELDKEQDESQLALISFEFTALGVGHITLTDELTTCDWKQFRFHGNLPLRCTNIQGQLLVKAHDTASSVD